MTTETFACSCGRPAIGGRAGGGLPPQQWCEQHEPADPYDPDAGFLPDLSDDQPVAPVPPPAVAQARALVWLAELARDYRVEVAGLDWARHGLWQVHVARPGDVDVLADALGLPPGVTVHGFAHRVAAREGDAWDMRIKVFGPAGDR